MKFEAAIVTIALLAASAAAQSIAEVVGDSPDHTTLLAAVGASTLGPALSDENSTFTVFAPTDDAFMPLVDAGVVTRLTSAPWQMHLDCVLLGHVHGDMAIFAADIPEAAATVKSLLDGYDLTVTSADRGVTVNDVSVVEPFDLPAGGSVIHSISDVLLPDCMSKNIVEHLSAAGKYSTLIQLVTDAGLADALMADSDEGLTVFAPSDDAFGMLPKEYVDFLTDGNNTSILAEVLTYHVAGGVVVPETSTTLPTLSDGNDLMVTVEDGVITVGSGDSMVKGSILASNGIIHEISSVLVPDSVVALLPNVTSPPTSPPTMKPTEDDSGAFSVSTWLMALVAVSALLF